jgi:ribosomal protein S27E
MTDPNNPQHSPQSAAPNPPARQKKFLAFSAACPSCGAQVSFHSTASVMAVCEYCQTTILRDENTIRDQGKMSAILEDYSPLQIGSSGFLDGLGFALIGRIQLQYTDGFWNEWYLQFDDGTNGWLSDASGLYVITRAVGHLEGAPFFSALSINQIIVYDSISFRVTDCRHATCTGGQGELPFVVGQGWQTSVADLRFRSRFISLDYTDTYPPQVYDGQAVTLPNLKFQLLRDVDQVQSTTGQIKGKVTNIECPNCGSPIPYVMGMAEHLLCPACRAEVAIAGEKVELLVKHKELTTLKSALSLGDKATIDQHAYVVIGLMQMEEVGEAESSLWTEYLLYSLEAGFLWLVDSGEENWQKTTVLNEIPEDKVGNAFLHGKRWDRHWAYQGRVVYAVGAFNWRVKIGDTTSIVEYKNGNETLISEQNANEINWSLSTPVSGFLIRQWFGKKQPTTAEILNPPLSSSQSVLKWLSILLWTINLPIIVFGSGSFFLTLIAQFAIIFLPVIMERTESDNTSLNEMFGKTASLWAWGLVIVLLTMFINLSNDDSSSSSWGRSRGYGGAWSSGGGHK